MACQNGPRRDRCSTGGRPGDRKLVRLAHSDPLFFSTIDTSDLEVLRPRVEFTKYTSIAFGNRCKEMDVRPSMGTVGDAYDNTMAESFFASLECELIDRRSWQTKTEARLALFTYIEGWYNQRRRHSSLGQISPANFESKHSDKIRPRPPRRQHGIPTDQT